MSFFNHNENSMIDALPERIKAIATSVPATFTEMNGRYSLEAIVAERRSFLSPKKLTYRAFFRIDEMEKVLLFSEELKETGAGLTGAGVSFKTETYKTGTGGREGNIAEQSSLFGERYDYTFDYAKVRRQAEDAAREAGFDFKYMVNPAEL